MSRLNEVFLFVGRKGVGKTTKALELAFAMAKASNRSVIVLDDMVHPAYASFDKITQSELPNWNGTKCVCLFDDLDSVLNDLTEYKANAVVVLEDCSRFISANISQAVKAFIINHRKLNFDVFFMFHFLNDVPPYICKQYSKMLLFKTGDNTEVKQQKWANWHSIVKKLQKCLQHKSYNHCEIVSIDE